VNDLLGAYVLGILDADEQVAVRDHLDGCEPCRRERDGLREMAAALGEIPPEALLDGPAPDGARLLDRLRAEDRAGRRRRSYRIAAAGSVVTVAALAGAIVAGRVTAPGPRPAAPPVAGPAVASSPPAGTRTGTATGPGTRMTVLLQPAAGWVRVRVTVDGVPAGEMCRLVAVAADGGRQQAASWLAGSGPVTVDGSALMAPARVSAVQAETYAGRILVVVPL
jgi:anti-sigma factor RsiW